ncbi:MAG: Crp/Fnr family transcriptional regulator [Alphaproteobacteria bacterium]
MHIVIPKIVRALPLFADLSEQEKDELLRQGKIHRFPKDEHLFVYGDEVKHFYIIGQGTVQLFRETPDGHEMTSEVLIAGDTIGETEILKSQSTHQFNAVAVKDSIVMEFPIGWLKDTAKHHGTFALNLLDMLSNRIHIASIEAEHKSTMSAAQQVACFLERLCILRDYDPRGFDLPYSKSLIASRLGMEVETFSRALAKIREHGISVLDTRVSFTNLEKMENYVCADCSISDNCKEHETLKALLLQSKTPSTTRV